MKLPLSNFKGGGGVNSKMYTQELLFLCSASHLMMLYISMKFHEKNLNSF